MTDGKTLGIVNLPQLAQVLANLGYSVYTGNGTFQNDVDAVVSALDNGAFPVVIADTPRSTPEELASHLLGLVGQANTCLVLLENAAGMFELSGAPVIQAPAEINDILRTANVGGEVDGSIDGTGNVDTPQVSAPPQVYEPRQQVEVNFQGALTPATVLKVDGDIVQTVVQTTPPTLHLFNRVTGETVDSSAALSTPPHKSTKSAPATPRGLPRAQGTPRTETDEPTQIQNSSQPAQPARPSWIRHQQEQASQTPPATVETSQPAQPARPSWIRHQQEQASQTPPATVETSQPAPQSRWEAPVAQPAQHTNTTTQTPTGTSQWDQPAPAFTPDPAPQPQPNPVPSQTTTEPGPTSTHPWKPVTEQGTWFDEISQVQSNSPSTPRVVTHADETDLVDLGRPDKAKTIFVIAAKGGVLKTTITRSLAERAATEAKQRTILIDGNQGQGDQRNFLRIDSSVPSIFEMAVAHASAKEVILSPIRINQARPKGLPPVHFAAALAPSIDMADGELIGVDEYRELVGQAQYSSGADLVVIDTQIIEPWQITKQTQMAGGLVLPELQSGAYCLALTEAGRDSYRNLIEVLTQFSELGVDRSHVLTAVTKYDPDPKKNLHFNLNDAVKELQQYSVFMGTVLNSKTAEGYINAGRINHADPSIAPVLDRVIETVTGIHIETKGTPQKRRRWGRRK